MSIADLDKHFLESICALHSREHLKTNKPSRLQLDLEECIKQKTGIVKDLSPYTMRNRHVVDEIRDDDIVIEDNKLASNSELELALLKDDLMCIVCNGMDVAAGNRLLECSECHSLYHQECHQPPVILFELDDTWTCQKCEDVLKQTNGPISPIEIIPATMVTTSKYIIKKSPPLTSLHANTTGVPGILKLSNIKTYTDHNLVRDMWATLEPGSSPIDWCEDNYTFSPMIAEFVNTFSNILFLILPPLLIHLFRGYGKIINPGIHIIWVLLIVVGLASAYFHATLSLVGQLLDELSILWVFFAAFSMFYPKRLFPTCIHNDRKRFSMGAAVLGSIGTGLAIIYPAVNAFALMTLGIPSVVLLIHEIRRTNNERVYRLGIRCASVWLLAVFCWVNDKLLCEAWSSINFPYLHGLWHIFIFISSYTACVLFAYFAVKEEQPEKKAILRYWPKNNFEFGIPYVSIKTHIELDNEI